MLAVDVVGRQCRAVLHMGLQYTAIQLQFTVYVYCYIGFGRGTDIGKRGYWSSILHY